MRDYWLTQYILAAVGWGYGIVCIGAIALALWLPRGTKAKALSAAVVIGIASILPFEGYEQYRKEQEAAEAYKARLAKAQALFDERCKTAGEKIHKTVDNVDGVIWTKWRSTGLSKGQFSLDDPYGKDCSMEGCILRLLQSDEARNGNRTIGKKAAAAYKFIETIDPIDGLKYRYIGVTKKFMDLSEDERLKHVRRTGYGADANGDVLALKRTPIDRFSARYGITWEDVSTPSDRQFWIAGGTLKVVDTHTNEVIAERLGYLLDTGQGNTAGFRDPWGWALSYGPQCPRSKPSTSDFAMRVLQPSK